MSAGTSTSSISSTSSRVVANGVDLHVQRAGAGEPLVFVHGSFTDSQAWRFVAPALADDFDVVSYDRRGHSRSGRGAGLATRQDEEDDLIALIEVLDLAPVHLVGSSYGSSISLAVAARRPDLLRTVVAHEPALLDTVAGPAIEAARAELEDIRRQLASGDLARGTRRFVEDLILGPGWWDQLPDATRAVMVANAATVVDMLADPGWASLDLDRLDASEVPVLLTDGDGSPQWFRTIADGIAERAPSIARVTYPGAGHMPHVTHPADLVAAVHNWTTGRTIARA